MKSACIPVVFLIYFVETNIAKETYSEILTNDNELLILESLKANIKTYRQHSEYAENNATAVKEHSEHNQTENNKSKLIVNVVYLNTKNEKKSTRYLPARSSAAPVLSAVRLVYISIDSQNPCVPNLCKPNQVCVPRPLNQTSINYECVAATTTTKITIAQIDKKKKTLQNKVTSSKQLPSKTQSNRPKTILLTKGCTMNVYIETRLAVFELFRSTNKNSITEAHFHLIDANSDGRVTPNELLAHFNNTLPGLTQNLNLKCLNDLCTNLNEGHGRFVSLSELRAFMETSRPKCSLIRASPHSDFKQFYIKTLNNALFNTDKMLSVVNLVPICNTDGYFMASQCDEKVTCWCVNRLGVPVDGTARPIGQTPVDCRALL